MITISSRDRICLKIIHSHPASLKKRKKMNMATLTELARSAPEIRAMMADYSNCQWISSYHMRLCFELTVAMAHFRPYLSARNPIEKAAMAVRHNT